VQGDTGAIDVRSLLSALIGGGAAIAGVFLAAWRERVARQSEEKARFQRETLIELQDTLQIFFRESYALHLWQTAPKRWEEDNKAFAEHMGTVTDHPEEQ
jgi:5-methylthioribose kinase